MLCGRLEGRRAVPMIIVVSRGSFWIPRHTSEYQYASTWKVGGADGGEGSLTF